MTEKLIILRSNPISDAHLYLVFGRNIPSKERIIPKRLKNIQDNANIWLTYIV